MEFECKPKNQKWIRSGHNPEGKQMYRQVTVKVPEIKKKDTDDIKIIPPGRPLHLHHPDDVGDQRWQNEDG